MLQKAHKVIRREACITLCEAMVLPLFDYCSTVWGSCGKMNSDYQEKLNRLPASIIEGRIDQVDARFTLHWPLLQPRRKYIGMLVFKCLNGIAPTYLPHEFHFGSDVHGYNTRQKDHLCPPSSEDYKVPGFLLLLRCKSVKLLATKLKAATLH